MKSYAPGKLILSGEHAVVYGHPALAMAINRYVVATITRELLPKISFDLSDLAHRSDLSFYALKHLKERIRHKYHRFIRGDFSIREVLQKPFELAHFALGVFAESLNYALPHGVNIQVKSDIPIGCGMGSSAATIVSVMHAIANYLELPLGEEKLFKLALEAEKMQHGYSSGVDLKVALRGGCLYMEGQKIESRPIPRLPMYLVNTGMPLSSTGQCVEKVAPYFKSGGLGEAFANVTKAMDKAIQAEAWQVMRDAIQHNHQLLVRIGAVPEKVKYFISQIETQGGVAKVCGAGAVIGDQGGVVLVISDDLSVIAALCERFGYNIISIIGESRGVHAI